MFCTRCGRQTEKGLICEECIRNNMPPVVNSQYSYIENEENFKWAQYQNSQRNTQNPYVSNNNFPIQTIPNGLPYQMATKQKNTSKIIAIIIPIVILLLVFSMVITSVFLNVIVRKNSDPIVGKWSSGELTLTIYSNGDFEMDVPESNSRITGYWEHNDTFDYAFTGTELYFDGDLIVGGYAIMGVEFVGESIDVIKVTLQMQTGNYKADIITGMFYKD